MSKKSLEQRNIKRKKLVALSKEKRFKLKQLINNKTISAEERHAISVKLWSLPRNSSSTRVKNRCLVTSRSRGYIRKFGMSRLVFREQASQGFIPGVIKSSNF